MSSALPTDTRIGIIGAGPSGIAAAWFLVKNGYKNITVLEKEQEVGGKSMTREYTSSKGDTKKYEMGSEYITFSYDVVYTFIDELNEPMFDAGPVLTIDGGGKFKLSFDLGDAETILALLRYFNLSYQCKDEIDYPSNENLSNHPILSLSCDQLIKQFGLEPIQGIILVEQFGYGTLEEFTALHMFRTVSHDLLVRIVALELNLPFFPRPVAAFPVNGTQTLFKNMAARISAQKEIVHPGSPAFLIGRNVTKVVPQGNTLEVHVGATNMTFDKVICAIPPNLVAEIMELDVQWYTLFKQIKYHPYWVGVMDMLDQTLPQGFYQNEELGSYEPAQFSMRYLNNEVITYGYNYNYARDAAENPRPEIDSTLTRYMNEEMGVKQFDAVDLTKYWENYYPHVSLEEFRSGYYDKLGQFQGTNGVYLTGDTHAMESLEYSCRHAKLVVDKFFCGRPFSL
ncbi:Adrenodoxin reductase [Gracilaria domingensis]|nr:Adrenodoxin reductase [Gracilaria domingensis]